MVSVYKLMVLRIFNLMVFKFFFRVLNVFRGVDGFEGYQNLLQTFKTNQTKIASKLVTVM